MPQRSKIIELRALLEQRHGTPTRLDAVPAERQRTGIISFDTALGGGLPRGALTELVRPAANMGAALLIAVLIAKAAEKNRFVALVDGTDSFDATALTAQALSCLLWVRCARNTNRLLRATELLCRDGQMSLIVSDATDLPATELHQFGSPTIWHRLGRCLESSSGSCLVVTSRTMVGSAAHTRLVLRSSHPFAALGWETATLLPTLQFEVARRREERFVTAPNLAALRSA
jgi:hypothetical protein